MAVRQTPSVLTALDTALSAAEPADADAATVALAKRYAHELDDAAVVSTAMTKALRQLARAEVDTDLYDKFEGLAARIEAVHVAATVGPKLLAALEQLQLTPKARSAVVTGGGGGNAGPSKLDELRSRRENRASAVDSTTS